MKQSIDYASVLDFSGLPAVREILRRKEPGFKITNLSPLDISTAHTDTARQNAAQSLHKVANAVFNNLSHGLELPWEKYLSEMHEFAAPSRSNLQIFGASDIIPNDWSTLTLLVNTAAPSVVHVLFGTALAVFSEANTPVPSTTNVDLSACTSLSESSDRGDWVVYHVRPNEDVYYTRAAGALMTPLSTEEHESRQRVRTAIK